MQRWLPLILVGVLIGCVHYQPKPLSPARIASSFDSRSLADEGLRQFVQTNAPGLAKRWPPQQWHLSSLTLAAFYFHPSLEVARAQWRVAKAAIITAGGRPNPTLSVTPEYDVNPASGVSPWLPSVNFDTPIETAGKRKLRIAQADRLSEAAWLNIRTTAWQVRSDVRASLLDFVVARKRVSLLQGQLSLQQEIVNLMEQRVQVGEISTAEITTARVNLARTQTELADARRQEAQARGSLATAIGVPLGAFNGLELSFDLSKSPNAGRLASGEVRRQALQSRADILGALAEYAASQSALQLEIAKQYPDVHLGPGYQWDQGESKWQLGLSVELPVLNRNQGPIAEAKARREEAAARFSALQAKALTAIDTAATLLRASRNNLSAAQSFAAAQEKQTGTVVGQYEAGAVDRLELLNARFEVAVSAVAVLEAQQALQHSLGALEDAVQRPFEGEFRDFPALSDGEFESSSQQAM